MQTHAPTSFDQLVELPYRPPYRSAVHRCGTQEKAMDLTPQTFCFALRRFRQLRERGKFKSWLHATSFRAAEFTKLCPERLHCVTSAW